GLFELGLGGVGVLLLDTLEDGLGGLVHERLGLLQTEGGQAAHLLDDGDLRAAGRLEDDVEIGLLLLLGGGLATAGCGTLGDGHGGGGGDVEDLLELLHELRELDEGHLLERFDELVVAELRHGGVPSCWWDQVPAVCGAFAPGRAIRCPGAGRPEDSSVVVGLLPVAGGCGSSPRSAQAVQASCVARRASTVRAVLDSGAANTAAALDIDAVIAPAALASRTSRDSRSASFLTSCSESGLPSK